MGGDAIASDRPADSSLEALDVTRQEMKEVFSLYIQHRVFYDATISADGSTGRGRDPEVYTYWINEMDFLTLHAREEVQKRLPRQPMTQFEKIYWVLSAVAIGETALNSAEQ